MSHFDGSETVVNVGMFLIVMLLGSGLGVLANTRAGHPFSIEILFVISFIVASVSVFIGNAIFK